MTHKKIFVTAQKGVNFSFENYYSLLIKEATCKITIPIYGINSNNSPKVPESVSVKELISVGDTFKIDLIGDVEISHVFVLSEIIQVTDNQLELVLSLQN